LEKGFDVFEYTKKSWPGQCILQEQSILLVTGKVLLLSC